MRDPAQADFDVLEATARAIGQAGMDATYRPRHQQAALERVTVNERAQDCMDALAGMLIAAIAFDTNVDHADEHRLSEYAVEWCRRYRAKLEAHARRQAN
jgi:TorA maturation chaperone TorD